MQQMNLFDSHDNLDCEDMREAVQDQLTDYLNKHFSAEDLGDGIEVVDDDGYTVTVIVKAGRL